MLIIQLILSGIQAGAIYALTAAGFALIFGATRIFHVAHAATFTLAGYVFVAGMNAGLGWVGSLVPSSVVAIAFGLAVERLVYRPIGRSQGSFFTVFVASFGVNIVVQSLIELVFGRSFTAITTPLSRAREVLPGIYLAPAFWVALVAAGALFGALGLFLGKTHAGTALRALFHSRELLQAFGLAPSRLSQLAFAIGSAMVVPGAVLTAATTGLQPTVGSHLMLISLAATMVGGIGSLWGAALSGLLLGLTESLAVAAFDTQWSEAATFVVLFGFILMRPSGMLGRSLHR